MATYTIEESTLTGIADALRRKHGETKLCMMEVEKTIPSVKISKTSNATGFDSCEGDTPTEKFFDVVSFEEASAILVKIGWGAKSLGVMLYIGEGEAYDESSFYTLSNIKNYQGDLFNKCQLEERIFNGNTITFYYNGASSTDFGYYAECTPLDADGNSIGGKTIVIEEEIEVLNTYNPLDMPEAIDVIEVKDPDCNGMHISESALTIRDACNYRFYGNSWNWFIEHVGDKIKTENISNTSSMFYGCNSLKRIPFDLNFYAGNYYSMASMFSGCSNLEEIGDINDAYPSDMSNMFSSCYKLRYLPNFNNLNLDRIYTNATTSLRSMFGNCYSLRSIPEEFLKRLSKPTATSYLYPVLSGSFSYCYALDEIRGLNPQTGAITSNMFASAFVGCGRLKDLIFATDENGECYSVNWKSQTIDLSSYVGYISSISYILNYNSGITEATRIVDDATYEQFKNHPDSWTSDVAYSRFNHDSAVRTLQSLPDTSAYLATAGGTNTIKFKGAAGSKTDGSAINTMSPEEIAIATQRGWTVTFA